MFLSMEKIAFGQSQKVKIRSILIFKIGKNVKPKVDLTVRNLPWAQKSLTLLKKGKILMKKEILEGRKFNSSDCPYYNNNYVKCTMFQSKWLVVGMLI